MLIYYREPTIELFWASIVVGVLLGIYILYGLRGNIRPKLTTKATVISKKYKKRKDKYYIKFKFAGGRLIILETDLETYSLLENGDSGKLTFQGYKLVDFK